MMAMPIIILASGKAKAISWGDVSETCDHTTGEVRYFFEKLRGDIQKLGQKLKSTSCPASAAMRLGFHTNQAKPLLCCEVST
jgi:hypothetical protein